MSHIPNFSATIAAVVAAVLALLIFATSIMGVLSRTPAAHRAKSSTDMPWPPKRYPRMVERLGPEIFDQAALYVSEIAREVDKQADCDRVKVIKIETSSTPRSVHYVALCHNGYRDRIDVDFTRMGYGA